VVPGVLADASSGAALFDVSEAGSLAYVPGAVRWQMRSLVLVDRTGSAKTVSEASGPYVSPRMSPDGKRIALWVEEAQAEVFVQDLARDTMTRLTFGGDSHSPAWSPDGTRLAFESGRHAVHEIYERPADGTGSDRLVTRGEHHRYLSDWSKDGRYLAYTEFHPDTGADVWITDASGSPSPRPIARTAASEKEAAFSPDGRWIAYASDESGQFEVYLHSLVDPRSRVRVSSGGGEEPAWSADGRELFYRHERQLLATPVRSSSGLEVGKASVLFEGSYHDNIAPTRSYDVTPDGRFLMVTEPAGDDLPQELTLVLGWAEELKRRLGAP
jgi:Tol biopolymer transport system component